MGIFVSKDLLLLCFFESGLFWKVLFLSILAFNGSILIFIGSSSSSDKYWLLRSFFDWLEGLYRVWSPALSILSLFDCGRSDCFLSMFSVKIGETEESSSSETFWWSVLSSSSYEISE